jgi:phosphatidylinositol alpha-1,6-mannosyltransferase
VYAVSALTIPAGVVCGALLRRPTIGELLGTYLHPHLDEKYARLRHFEEVIAFKSPVDRLLILNDGTRGDEVARTLGTPGSRVRFWMHGLDLEACSAAMKSDARAELGLPAGVPLIVSASRLAGWKRIDRILRAVPAVLASQPDALFVLSGSGPEQEALESLVETLEIARSVQFIGALPRDTNLRLIAAADVFCALYDYSCVGVALLEALGCGRSVVVADTGGTRDFVQDRSNGLVVNADDAQETAAAILRLLRDSELRDRLGTEARRRAEYEYLTPEQRSSLSLQTIDEILGVREDTA